MHGQEIAWPRGKHLECDGLVGVMGEVVQRDHPGSCPGQRRAGRLLISTTTIIFAGLLTCLRQTAGGKLEAGGKLLVGIRATGSRRPQALSGALAAGAAAGCAPAGGAAWHRCRRGKQAQHRAGG